MDDVFLPQDDWSLLPPTLILCYPKLVYFHLKEAYLLYSNKMYQIIYYVIVSNY